MADDPAPGPVSRLAGDAAADEVMLPDPILAGLPARADDSGPYCGPIIERA